MNRKFPFIATIIIVLLLLAVLLSRGGGTPATTPLTPQGFLGNTPPGVVEASSTAETIVQLDGQPIQPQLGTITTVIEPGTQWVLKDLWEDHRCQVVQGRTVCYDWGFYCQIGGSRCIVAECMDPYWDLPYRGMVYTANPNVAANTSIVLIPPSDIPAPNEGWQKFLSIYEILNPGLVYASPTASLTSPPTIAAQGTTVPGATSFAALQGTPQPRSTGGVPLSTALKVCIPVLALALLVIAVLVIRNRRSS